MLKLVVLVGFCWHLHDEPYSLTQPTEFHEFHFIIIIIYPILLLLFIQSLIENPIREEMAQPHLHCQWYGIEKP